jgi:hypothetical protein
MHRAWNAEHLLLAAPYHKTKLCTLRNACVLVSKGTRNSPWLAKHAEPMPMYCEASGWRAPPSCVARGGGVWRGQFVYHHHLCWSG